MEARKGGAARQALIDAAGFARAKDFDRAADACLAAAAKIEAKAPSSRLLKARLLTDAAEYLNLLKSRAGEADLAAREAIRLLGRLLAAETLMIRACQASGQAAWSVGGPVAALPPYRRARRLLERFPGKKGDLAQALDNEALCLHALGRVEEALSLQRRGLKIATRLGLAERRRSLMRRMSNALQDLDQEDQAEELLEAARPPSRASVRERVGWFHSRALLAERRGRYSQAEGWFDRAADLLEKHPDKVPDMVACLVNAALLKIELGSEAQARRLLAVADAIAPSETPSSYFVTRGIADALMAARAGDFQRASRLFGQSRERATRRNRGNRAYELSIVAVHASLLRDSGRTHEAERLLRSVLPTSDAPCRIGEEEFPIALALAELLIAGATDVDLARALLRTLVSEVLPACDAETRWRVLSATADLAASAGRNDSAVYFGKLAVLEAAGSLASFPPNAHQRDAILARRETPALVLLRRLIDQERLTEAGRARSLLSVERARALALRRNPGPADDRLAFLTDGELEFDAEFGKALALGRSVSATLADPFARGAERQDAQAKLEANAATLAGLFDAKVVPVPGRPVPSRMGLASSEEKPPEPDKAIIRYFTGDARIYAQVVTHREAVQLQIDVAPQALAGKIFSLVEAIRHGDDGRAVSQELYHLLLDPFEPMLDRVVGIEVAAHGALADLPFGVLHDGTGYLVERFAFENRSGVPGSGRRRSPTSIALFGASRAIAGFPALKHVRAELAAAAEEFTQATRHLDSRFTTGALQAALSRGAGVVHVASHYHLVPGSPSRSFLLLGNGEKLSTAAFLSEAFDWKATSVVFLSACETAAADTVFADGSSLAAALHLKGVSEVVVTNWPVADDSTALLAAAFYRGFHASKHAGTALRQAQLSLLRQGNGSGAAATRALGGKSDGAPFSYPLHWAPFRVFVPGR